MGSREQRELSQRLRERGESWVRIARLFRRRYRLGAITAFRLAHGWSQGDLANRLQQRWSGWIVTNKSVSYWEQWPARTGHQPKWETYLRLAEIFQCAVGDLLDGDLSHLDTAWQQTSLLCPHGCGRWWEAVADR